MAKKILGKDPGAVLDYSFDWVNDDDGRWLQTGETINSHAVIVSAGITNDSDSESNGIVTVWLSGGTAGTSYIITCKIVTSEGRKDERSIEIVVSDR